MKARPCPICGCKQIDILESEAPYNDFIASCHNCDFSFDELGLYGDWPEDAIKLWNDELDKEEWQVLFYGEGV